MASYRWTLQTFRITDTRSHHDDTLIAGLAVSVNSTFYPPVCAQMGDFNNGDHSFAQHGLKSLDITANSDDAVQMIYQIYNNGNQKKPNLADLTAALTQDVNTINQARVEKLALVEAASKKPLAANRGATLKPLDDDDDSGDLSNLGQVGLDPPQGEVTQLVNEPGAFWYDLFTGGFYTLFQYAFKSCDGPVALGGFATTQLSSLVDGTPNHTYAQADTFNAKKLNLGVPCNSSGSNYIVNWTVQAL